MEKKRETAIVVLTYCDGDDETYVHLYHTREAAIDCIVEDAVDDLENLPEDERRDPKELADEARKSLEENGYWKDGEGNTYVLEEKEFVK